MQLQDLTLTINYAIEHEMWLFSDTLDPKKPLWFSPVELTDLLLKPDNEYKALEWVAKSPFDLLDEIAIDLTVLCNRVNWIKERIEKQKASVIAG